MKSRENADNSRDCIVCVWRVTEARHRRSQRRCYRLNIVQRPRNERSRCRIYKRIVFAEFDRAGKCKRAGNNADSVPRRSDAEAALRRAAPRRATPLQQSCIEMLRVYLRCEKNAIFANLYFYQIRRQFTWAGMLIECDSDKLIVNVSAWK